MTRETKGRQRNPLERLQKNTNMAEGTENIPTPELLEEESRMEEERRQLISSVTLEIEKLLIKNDLTMGGWSEIADLLNERSIRYFATIKIKTIQDNYGKI